MHAAEMTCDFARDVDRHFQRFVPFKGSDYHKQYEPLWRGFGLKRWRQATPRFDLESRQSLFTQALVYWRTCGDQAGQEGGF